MGATDSPLNLHNIEVKWAEKTRDPTQITEENCADMTRNLKQKCERGGQDNLVVYYWEIEDAQSGENWAEIAQLLTTAGGIETLDFDVQEASENQQMGQQMKQVFLLAYTPKV